MLSVIVKVSDGRCFVGQVDRLSQDQDLDSPPGQHVVKARAEKGGFDIPLTDQQWRDFTALTLADWLEQVRPGSSPVKHQYLFLLHFLALPSQLSIPMFNWLSSILHIQHIQPQ